MELDPQAVINEITRQRNEALDRCAVLVSEITMLRDMIKVAEKPKKEKDK